jgi:hypothetical protein
MNMNNGEEQQRRERRTRESRTTNMQFVKRKRFTWVVGLRTPQSPRNVCGQDSTLVQNQQTRNRSTAQCAQDTGDQRADRQSCYVAGPARGDLGEHTNLGTQRADVAEAAETVCRDQL